MSHKVWLSLTGRGEQLHETDEFLKKLRFVPKLPERTVLCTIDVVGLYPNIQHKQGNAINTKFANPYTIIFMADLEEDKMLDLEYNAFVW